MGALHKFGAALRSLRQAGEGLTLEELATRADVPATNISKYELEKAWPSREVLERILDGLGISFLDLAIEVDRQQRLSRGEAVETPTFSPPPDMEERMRTVAIDVFASGLRALAGVPSLNLEVFAESLRQEGIEPDPQGLAILEAMRSMQQGGGGNKR